MPPLRKHQLTRVQKARCLGWLDQGVTQKVCAERLSVHLCTIKRLVKRHKATESGEVPNRKEGTGRLRKVTDVQVKTIKEALHDDPFLTAKAMKSKFKELGNLSLRTIRRVATRDLDLRSYVAKKKPHLTKSMKQRRLKFAKKFLQFSANDWKKVTFTDETMVVASLDIGVSQIYF